MGIFEEAAAAGRARRDEQLVRSAYHEAGHVVVAHHYGADVRSAHVIAAAGLGGKTTYGAMRPGEFLTRYQEAAVRAAGTAALAHAGAPSPAKGAESDDRQLYEIVAEISLDNRLPHADVEAEARRMAAGVVAARWSAVEALAEALVHRVRLAGSEIAEVIAKA